MTGRNGYTLAELVAVLISASVLLLGLSTTVFVTTDLNRWLDQDDSFSRNQRIAECIGADFRYATAIDSLSAEQYAIDRINPVSETMESIVYTLGDQGIQRQNTLHLSNLEKTPVASHSLSVDSDPPVPSLAKPNMVRVRSISRVDSGNKTTKGLTIAMPDGCVDGDLLVLCLGCKQSTAMLPAEWVTIESRLHNTLELSVAISFYNSAIQSTAITLTDSGSIAAVMLAMEHANPLQPVNWAQSRSIGFLGLPPTPLEPSTMMPNHLNLQVFAFDGEPLRPGSIGIMGLVDVARVSVALQDSQNSSTLVVSLCNGLTPKHFAFSFALLDNLGDPWRQIGLCVQAAP